MIDYGFVIRLRIPYNELRIPYNGLRIRNNRLVVLAKKKFRILKAVKMLDLQYPKFISGNKSIIQKGVCNLLQGVHNPLRGIRNSL